jgi:hypothetical protein
METRKLNKEKGKLPLYWKCPLCGVLVTDFRGNAALLRQRIHNHLTKKHSQKGSGVWDRIDDFFEKVMGE